jgi:hypothetical protein
MAALASFGRQGRVDDKWVFGRCQAPQRTAMPCARFGRRHQPAAPEQREIFVISPSGNHFPSRNRLKALPPHQAEKS